MFNSFFRVMLSVMFIPALAGFVQAQGTLRRFDDLTFNALTAARSLRWEIHDDFAQSRDQAGLLKDAEHMISDLHGIQRMIYERRSPQDLDRELDITIQHAAELRRDLLACDFYRVRPASTQFNSNGYTFQPATRSAGRTHVDHALQMLAGVEGELTQLHRELLALMPGQRPGHGVTTVPVSRPVLAPGYPASVRPLQMPVLKKNGMQLQYAP